LTPSFPGLSFHEPGQITTERCRQASEPFQEAGVALACLSGYSSLMDPNLERRHRSIIRLHALLRHCGDFGTSYLATETGSLSPKSPWAPYPPNRSPEAWTELRLIVAEALRVAADHGATLLLKADSTHVLATVEDCTRLREELDHPSLGFVLDPANFLVERRPASLRADVERIFELLGSYAPVVHAKDIRFEGDEVVLPRTGHGVLDYCHFFRLLRQYQPDAPVILEHLRPEEVADTVKHVVRFMSEPGA
jgi:sugar phosphate isomerase/epimerase